MGRIAIIFVLHVFKICEPKLPRPWKTSICNDIWTNVDKSDHVKKVCSKGEVCVPIHYSEIGCANIGALRNTTVSKLVISYTNKSLITSSKIEIDIFDE